jgi:GABA(A) receptor-associated protein
MNINKNVFLRNLSFEKRCEIVNNLREKYPDKIPIMISDDKNKKTIKFLVPDEITLMNLLVLLRKRIKLESHESIYIFANIYKNKSDNKKKDLVLCCMVDSIASVYSKYKDEDGMLYLSYSKENTFG